ncbi:MAG: bacillithiol biosynthesis BshC [Sphingobacteriales bacterium]|nr:bacillithiol biosynthesis BshC [Sphingobacteriales bacterium]
MHFIDENLSYSELPYFSPLIRAFLAKSESTQDFHRPQPDLLLQTQELAALRSAFAPPPRQVLADMLLQQYEALPDNDLAVAQIQHLRSENTFTVCTGHQCCLAGGPLYILYKALHIIKVADFIKEQFPDLNIVPVFWLNSEDHDFAEINHFFVFGKKIEWTSPPLQGAAAALCPLLVWLRS